LLRHTHLIYWDNFWLCLPIQPELIPGPTSAVTFTEDLGSV